MRPCYSYLLCRGSSQPAVLPVERAQTQDNSLFQSSYTYTHTHAHACMHSPFPMTLLRQYPVNIGQTCYFSFDNAAKLCISQWFIVLPSITLGRPTELFTRVNILKHNISHPLHISSFQRQIYMKMAKSVFVYTVPLFHLASKHPLISLSSLFCFFFNLWTGRGFVQEYKAFHSQEADVPWHHIPAHTHFLSASILWL